MANKILKKVPLDKECLMEALRLRNSSIRKLGVDYYHFGWSSKTIERGIKDGEISAQIMDALGQYLDVDTDYLSGNYHRDAEKIKDESLGLILKSQLKAENFPYILKQQRIKHDGKFLYDRYLEFILILHDISLHQFYIMQFEKQKALQLDLEDAITKVLIKYFSHNAFGKDIRSNIDRIRVGIDNYDPNEPEIPEDFLIAESDETDPLTGKYSNSQIREASTSGNKK